MRREEFFFDSRDELTRIHAVKWYQEEQPPVAILQIVHGMAEYVLRYDHFAKAMAAQGYLVTGNDHLGHGQSRGENHPTGYFCARDAATVVVRDVHRLKKIIQEQHPGIPYFILGHSMGSFILRNYLFRYGKGIDGAIIVATGTQPLLLTKAAKVLASAGILAGRGKYPALLINILAFGSYNRRIVNPITHFDWLSGDREQVKRYVEDELCGFTFTRNGFYTLFELIERAGRYKNMQKIPDGLPILLLSGQQDPVGGYGAGVEDVYQKLKKTGCSKITLKLYPAGRHEILNELNREQVYEDVQKFIRQNCS